jgi:Fur family ferric uptake transcriptional regulator
MCKQCDYTQLLKSFKVGPTPRRVAVLRAIGEAPRPLPAADLLAAVRHRLPMNKVTLYRTLDLLVDRGLIVRLSGGDRAFRYGMGATYHHPEHPHLLCLECGELECLNPEMIPAFRKRSVIRGKGVIRSVDIRYKGVCESCLPTVVK